MIVTDHDPTGLLVETIMIWYDVLTASASSDWRKSSSDV